jgi:hypothetical protein
MFSDLVDSTALSARMVAWHTPTMAPGTAGPATFKEPHLTGGIRRVPLGGNRSDISDGLSRSAADAESFLLSFCECKYMIGRVVDHRIAGEKIAAK